MRGQLKAAVCSALLAFVGTALEGEQFPPARSSKGAHYGLKYAVPHSHKHSELQGTEAR